MPDRRFACKLHGGCPCHVREDPNVVSRQSGFPGLQHIQDILLVQVPASLVEQVIDRFGVSKHPSKELNRGLFRWSRLYRLWAGIRPHDDGRIDAIIDETRRSLLELAAILEREKIRFTVLVLPLLKPEGEWSAGDRLSRKQILDILREAGIRHFDLFETAMQAIAEGVNVCEEAGDAWHPSRDVAERFAAFLAARKLLDDA